MDIKLAQGVAAGIATGDTDPADPGLLKQRAKDEALLPGDHFAGFALIDAQFAALSTVFLIIGSSGPSVAKSNGFRPR